MEVAQYGNTEINLCEIKSTVEKLKQCNKDSGGMCKLQEEFEVSFVLKIV